jgi:hypothetical protein
VLKHAECSCGVFNRYLERNSGNALSGKKDENKGVYEGADEKRVKARGKWWMKERLTKGHEASENSLGPSEVQALSRRYRELCQRKEDCLSV